MNAADRILQKALVASPMNSEEWSGVQAGLRDRAFFSATVEEARILHQARECAAKIADGHLSKSEARVAIREVLAQVGHPDANRPGENDLRNLSSKRRLDLIMDQNTREARGFVRYKEGMSDGALAAFPAQELLRIHRRKTIRDWAARWRDAGGTFFDGRMIALKTDPIWTKISRFGHPWPPFDYNSGMGVRDVSRADAIRIGVIKKDDPPPKIPKTISMNDGLEAALPKGAGKPFEDELREKFGSQVRVDHGMVKFNESLISDMLNGKGNVSATLGKGKYNPGLLGKIEDPTLREKISETGLTVTEQWLTKHGRKHEKPSGKATINIPLSKADYDLIPSMWRNPDFVSIPEGRKKNEIDLCMMTLDGNLVRLGINFATGRPTTFRKENIKRTKRPYGEPTRTAPLSMHAPASSSDEKKKSKI